LKILTESSLDYICIEFSSNKVQTDATVYYSAADTVLTES